MRRSSLNVASATPPNVQAVDEEVKENMELAFIPGGVEVNKLILHSFLPELKIRAHAIIHLRENIFTLEKSK